MRRRSWIAYGVIIVATVVGYAVLVGFVFDLPSVVRTQHFFDAIRQDDVAYAQDYLKAASRRTATEGLFYARSAAMAELLIKAGADVDARNDYRCTPLHFAAGRAADEVVAVLLRHGANVTVRDCSGYTSLHWACGGYWVETGFEIRDQDLTRPRLETVRMLLASGAPIDTTSGSTTPLMVACMNGQTDVVRCLLESGADATRVVSGMTPLHCVVGSSSDAELIRLLISHGAEIDVRNWEGLTPLQTSGASLSVAARRLLGGTDSPRR